MAKTQVGQLEAILGLDAKDFVAGLRESQKKLGGFTAKANKSMDTMQKGFKAASLAIKGLGFAVAGLSIKKLIDMGDQYKLLQSRIANTAKTQADFVKSSQQLSRIANQTGASLQTTVDVFQRLNIGLESIGANTDQVLQLTETVQKLGVISGASTENLNAGLLQFGQAMGAGIVRAEEFNSIVENIPMVAQAIADGFETDVAGLRKMVLAGELLSEDVMNVLLDQTEDINRQFEKMPVTLGRLTNLAINEIGRIADLIVLNTVETTKLGGSIDQATDGMRAFGDFVAKSVRFVFDLGATIASFFVGIGSDLTKLFLQATQLLVMMVRNGISAVKELLPFLDLGGLLSGGINNLNKAIQGLKGQINLQADFSRETGAFFGQSLANTFNPGRALKRRTDATNAGGRLRPLSSASGASSEKVKKSRKAKDNKVNVSANIQRLTEVEAAYRAEVQASANALFEQATNQERYNDLLSQSASLIEGLRTPFEVYTDSVKLYDEMLANNLLTQENYNRAIDQAQETLLQADEGFQLLSQTVGRWSDTFIDSLARGQFEFKNFTASILADISRIVLQLTVLNPLSKAFSDLLKNKGGSSGVLGSVAKGIGSFFGGFFADGGRPPMGKVSVVGERGPELFVPDSAGTVVPAHAMGGTVVNNYYSINATDPQTFFQQLRQHDKHLLNMGAQGAQIAANRRGKRGPLER